MARLFCGILLHPALCVLLKTGILGLYHHRYLLMVSTAVVRQIRKGDYILVKPSGAMKKVADLLGVLVDHRRWTTGRPLRVLVM